MQRTLRLETQRSGLRQPVVRLLEYRFAPPQPRLDLHRSWRLWGDLRFYS